MMGHVDNVETWLSAEVADLLQLDKVLPTDDFLVLGGASLTAMELAVRVERRFSIELPLADIFEATSIAGIAEMIRAAASSV
jgi:acyl carrier protein